MSLPIHGRSMLTPLERKLSKRKNNCFTCKRFKFVLQVKLLFPNGAQVHLEIWADRILLNFLANLENFICDTFRGRTCKIKWARGKDVKESECQRSVLQKYRKRAVAANTCLREEYQGMRGADQSLALFRETHCSGH